MGSAKSLHAQQNELAVADAQLDVLSVITPGQDFRELVAAHGVDEVQTRELEILQVNLGKMCNQTCKHCHVDAGPDRKEIMTRETMLDILAAIQRSQVKSVDLTGGAPEMNPHFRWFVEELSHFGVEVIVRCNLTIILANPKYHDLPEFYKQHRVTVISSLPHFSALRTDAQRGNGVFSSSMKALKMLNEVGYGDPESGLRLHLVYNPTGAFLPGSQVSLEKEFKQRLATHDVVFNDLYTITNMPISRFLDYLVQSGNYELYMEKLVEAFNPGTLDGLMCRNTLSVGWDGLLFDCDFNQMLELPATGLNHISTFDPHEYANRKVVVGQHCLGCTAGSGSSCGGEVV